MKKCNISCALRFLSNKKQYFVCSPLIESNISCALRFLSDKNINNYYVKIITIINKEGL